MNRLLLELDFKQITCRLPEQVDDLMNNQMVERIYFKVTSSVCEEGAKTAILDRQGEIQYPMHAISYA